MHGLIKLILEWDTDFSWNETLWQRCSASSSGGGRALIYDLPLPDQVSGGFRVLQGHFSKRTALKGTSPFFICPPLTQFLSPLRKNKTFREVSISECHLFIVINSAFLNDNKHHQTYGFLNLWGTCTCSVWSGLWLLQTNNQEQKQHWENPFE